MRPTKPKKLFLLTTLWLGLFLTVFSLSFNFLNFGKHDKALAATSSTINFQARLLSSTGALVPDGFYNVQFKLYSASSGGSAQWTETYYDSNGGTAGNDNRVRVVNGYLSVYLGSQTALPNINWDQEEWLTLNIGGITQTASPTWDGEMNPRLKLSAVPYALRAGQLAKTTGANTSTLDFATQTGARSILLPDESGTLCIQSSTACGFAAASGSNSYIQNGTSVQTNANFNIQSGATGSVTAVIKALGSQTADLLQIQNSAGTPVLAISPNGTLTTTAIINANATGKTAIQLADSGAQNSGLTIGGDTNLYRSSANVLATDDNFLIGGNITGVGNITLSNPGIGNESRITFTKTNDNAWVSVKEVASDSTTYGFYMSDNPDSTADQFLWQINDWKGAGGAWQPLQFSGMNANIRAANINAYGDYNIFGPWYSGTDGQQNSVYQSKTGTLTLTPNVSGFTGSYAYYWVKIDGTGSPNTFSWGKDTSATTGAATATNVPITGGAQTLNSGVTVTFNSTTGGVVNDRYEFRVYKGGDLTADGTVQGAIVNGTSALQLNGVDINTAGTLDNVAYLNQANSFSKSQTITATNATTPALTLNSVTSAGDYTTFLQSGNRQFNRSSSGTQADSIWATWDTTDDRWEAASTSSIVGPMLFEYNYNGTYKIKAAGVANRTAGDALTFVDALTVNSDATIDLGAAGGKNTLDLTSTAANTGLTLGGDTNLYRSAANVLQTDDRFHIFRTSPGDAAFSISNASGSTSTFYSDATGKFQWGDGTAAVDTNLYRSAADLLKTDDSFAAAANIYSGHGTANQIRLNNNGQIQFGSAADTNLYRSAADTLKTDDNLVVTGEVTAPSIKQSTTQYNGTDIVGPDARNIFFHLPAAGNSPHKYYKIARITLDGAYEGAHINGTLTVGPHTGQEQPVQFDFNVYTMASAGSSTYNYRKQGNANTDYISVYEVPDGGGTNVDYYDVYVRQGWFSDAYGELEIQPRYANTQVTIWQTGLDTGTTLPSDTLLTTNADYYFDTTGNIGLGITPTSNKLQLASATTAAGGIGFGTDTNLYRSAANTLQTDGRLNAAGIIQGASSGTGNAFLVGNDAYLTDVNVANRFAIQGAQDATQGGLYFGSGLDTNLYRSAANVLQTDDQFRAADALLANASLADQVTVGRTASGIVGAGITFGSAQDTNIYRSAANTLKTDDDFISAGTITGSLSDPNGLGDNLLRNGNFESGLANWSLQSGTLGSVATNSSPPIGKNAYRASGSLSWIISNDYIPVDNTKTYRLEGWIHETVDEGKGAYLGLAYYDENKNLINTANCTLFAYIAALNYNALDTNWRYFAGEVGNGEQSSSPYSCPTGNQGSTTGKPGTTSYSKFIPGTRYVRVVALLNYNNPVTTSVQEITGIKLTTADTQHVNTALTPDTDNSYSLGTASYRWNNLQIGSGASNFAGAVTVGGLLTGQAGLAITGSATITGNITAGVADTAGATIQVYGNGAGNFEGGQLDLQLAADYDTTFNTWSLDAYQDDFRIHDGTNVRLQIDGATGNIVINQDVAIQGGDLTTSATTFNLLAGATTALNIGPGSTTATSINLAGGSGATGCTVDGSNGNLTCSGAISTTATSGTQGWWSRTGTTLSPASAGDSIATTGNLSIGSTTAPTGGVAYFNGNVGIGTSSPGSLLHVSGNQATPLVLQRTSSQNVNIEYRNSGGSIYAGSSPTNQFGIDDDNDLSDAPFSVSGNSGNITSLGTLTVNGTGDSFIGGSLGLNVANPQGAMTIQNSAWISALDAAGTGYVNILQVNSDNQVQLGAALSIDGGIVLPTDGGQLTLVDLPISAAALGTPQSYTFRVGSTNALTVYGESDGAGGAQNLRVAIGSSINPQYTLDVDGDVNTTGVYRVNGTQIGTSNLLDGSNIALLGGRAGGQSLSGGSGVNENLTLRPSSHGSNAGNVIVESASTNAASGLVLQQGSGSGNTASPRLFFQNTGSPTSAVAIYSSAVNYLQFTNGANPGSSSGTSHITFDLSQDKIMFGSATDTNLYRDSSGNLLKTDDAFTAVGNITTSGNFYGNNLILNSGAGNGIGFWGGTPTGNYGIYMSNVVGGQYGDVTDYYIASKITNGTSRGFTWIGGGGPIAALNATSGNLAIAGTFTANGTGKTTISLPDTTTTTGLTIGGDTNLYRNGSNELKTDDNFVAAGNVTASGYLTNILDTSFTNMVRNGSLENGTANWSVSNSAGSNGAISAYTTDSYVGPTSLRYTRSTFGTWAYWSNDLHNYLPTPSFSTARYYTLSFYAKSLSGTPPIRADIMDGNGLNTVASCVSSTLTLSTSSWQKYTCTFLPAQAGNLPKIYMTAGTGAAIDLIIDGITLTAGQQAIGYQSIQSDDTDNILLNGDLAVSGGDLTSTATTFNLLQSTVTTLNFGGAATTLNIGPGSNTATSINLAGGSSATGCTVNGANGNLTCSGAISTTATSGTQGWWSRSGTTLSPATAGDAITTSGNISTTGSGTLSVAGTSTLTGNVGIGTVSVANQQLTLSSSLSGGNATYRGIQNTTTLNLTGDLTTGTYIGNNNTLSITGTGNQAGTGGGRVDAVSGVLTFNSSGTANNLTAGEFVSSTGSSAGVVSAIRGLYSRVDSGSITNAIQSATGLYVANNAGTGSITNNYGIDIAALSGTSVAYGIRIAAPTGATTKAAINLSDTGGTSAGGLLFGTDTTLYRSAATQLTTNGVLDLGGVGGTAAVSTGSTTGDKIALYGNSYGLGIQSSRIVAWVSGSSDGLAIRANSGTGDHSSGTDGILLRADGLIYGMGKNAIQTSDAWLRLNNSSQFTNGTYTPSLLRADGGLQVGSGGAAFNATSAGNTSVSNTLVVGGSGSNNVRLYVRGTDGDTGSTQYGQLINTTFQPTNDLGGAFYGFYSNPTISDTSATGNLTGAYYGGRFQPIISNATRTVSTVQGLQVGINSSGAGTITSAQNIRVSDSYSTGDVTARYGLRVDQPSLASGATIGTSYGIYLENQAQSGAGTSYSIYSAGGDVNLQNTWTANGQVANTLGISGNVGSASNVTGLLVDAYKAGSGYSSTIVTGLDVHVRNSDDIAAVFRTDSGDVMKVLGSGNVAVGLSAAPANGVLTVGTNTTAASGGLYFGTDTNLYRGNANLLKTDDEFATTSANALRMVQGSYGSFFRNDGSSTYLLLTASGDQYGSWNSLRPFTVSNSTGQVTIGTILNANATGKTAIQIADSGAQSSGITIGGDTNLFRYSANILGTNDRILTVLGSGSDIAYSTAIGGNNGFYLRANGTMEWTDSIGGGVDTNLYRAASSVLRTDGSLYAIGQLRASSGVTNSQIILGEQGSSRAEITFGTALDTNLYRSTTDTLKTDSNFIIQNTSTAAFQVQDSSGTNYLLNADTTNREISINNGSVSVAGGMIGGKGGADGGSGSGASGDTGGGGGGGIGGGAITEAGCAGDTGGQAVDVSGLFDVLVGAGYSTTGPGAGYGCTVVVGGAYGGPASGFGSGGGGAGYYGGDGGNGLYGGGGGGASGEGSGGTKTGGAGGQGVVVISYSNGTNVVRTTGTSHTVPAGATSAKVWVIGAGGGGAGSIASNANSGGGGGAGGIAYRTFTVTPGQSITYSLGTAGSGGVGANNGAGGGITTATVGSVILTANGGAAGRYQNNSSNAGGTYSDGGGTITDKPLKIQNSFGVNLFNVDATNNHIVIGEASSKPTILVLGIKNTLGDPTCVNGGMYYNSSSNQAKVCINSSWVAVGVPTVTSLPSSPANGDEVYYQFNRGDGTNAYWHLRYNSSSTYWDYLGGPSMYKTDAGSPRVSAANTFQCPGAAATTVPLEGEYDVNYGDDTVVNNTFFVNTTRLAVAINGSTTGNTSVSTLGGNNGYAAVDAATYRYGATAGQTFSVCYRSDSSQTATWWALYMRITPTRVK